MSRIQIQFPTIHHADYISRLSESELFIANGMRRISLETLKRSECDGFLFNFDIGSGVLLGVDPSDETPVGIIKVQTSLRNQTSTIAGGIETKFMGTNAALDFFVEGLNFLYSNYPVERVELNILTTNTRSIRFNEKMGFRHEGLKRRAWFCNGMLNDQVIMGLLREEFVAKFGVSASRSPIFGMAEKKGAYAASSSH